MTRALSFNPLAERLIEGEPTILVKDGVTIERNLRREGLARQEVDSAIREHGIESVGNLRMRPVKQAAERTREVRRPEADRVDAIERENAVELLEMPRILDLRDDDDLGIRRRGIVAGAAVVIGRTAGPKAPDARRRIATGGDQAPCLLDGAHHRTDDAIDARVQDLLDGDGIVPGNADE